MDRRTRAVFAIALLAIVLVSGAAVILGGGSPTPSGPPPGTTPVVGVIVSVDSSGLTNVHSFTLRTGDGQLLTFGLGHLQNGVEFPPGHLAEHQVTAAAVRVWYRSDAGTLQAIRLEDAPG